MKNAQISMEYLMIVGVAVLLVSASVYFYAEKQRAYESEVISSRVNQIGATIMDNVKTVYNVGEGSRIVLDFDFPKGVNNMSIVGGRELIFSTHSNFGDSEMLFVCNFCSTSPSYTINGSFTKNDTMPGKKYIRVRNCRNFILIERVINNRTGEFESLSNINCG
jgi:hypothetical protein